jgi:anti-sigma B factor antagonist
MAEQLDLSTTIQGSCAVVSVTGEIDLGTASELSEAAVAAMREIGPNLVLDLSGVTFMDSTGLKVLLAVHRRAELSGGRLVLAGATRSVDRIVKITGFDQTFVVCDDVEAAIAACRDAESDPAAAAD